MFLTAVLDTGLQKKKTNKVTFTMIKLPTKRKKPENVSPRYSGAEVVGESQPKLMNFSKKGGKGVGE